MMTELETQPETPEESPAAKRSSAPIYALLALVFMIQLAMGAYVFMRHEQDAPLTGSLEHSDALQAQLQDQSQQLEALRVAFEATDSGAPNTEHFNHQQALLKELNDRLNALEASAAEPAPIGPMVDWKIEEIKHASAALEALKTQVQQEGQSKWQSIQLLTAFDRLEERVLAHEPYMKPLAAFALAAESLPDAANWKAALKPYQHEGVPSWEVLNVQFESARTAALASAADANTGQPSFWGQLGDNLSGLVQIRKTGPAHQGSDTGSVLARADYALAQQDTQGVLQELDALAPEKRELFAGFEADLTARRNLLALIDDIREQLYARIHQQAQ
jgi:hypothetical protein